MMDRSKQRSRALQSADDLSIRFVNTVAWRLRQVTEERLPAPKDLIAWFRQNEVAPARILAGVGSSWRTDPALALATHGEAIALREAVYRIFTARIAERRPGATDLDVVNAAIACGDPPRLDWRGRRIAWRIEAAEG